jgi:hypothetical protein
MLGIEGDVTDIRVLAAYMVLSVAVIYGMSFGVFAGVQKEACNEVKSWKQVALNALIQVGFHVGLLILVTFVPWFRNSIGDLFPPDAPAALKSTTAYTYYGFWATLLGGALGGSMSASCRSSGTMPALPELPTLPTGKAGELPTEE